jgi:organic hydroperoxide reductase OsmC/OhrA
MPKQHHYQLKVTWTGNKGTGTDHYTHYERSHTIEIQNKSPILASSDTPFLGDATKHNPEDFLLASLSTCHMLWYLHLCADAGIVVTSYTDQPIGILLQKDDGGGSFSEVTLNPTVKVLNSNMMEKANALHVKANQKCFIANSVNFEVKHIPLCLAQEND